MINFRMAIGEFLGMKEDIFKLTHFKQIMKLTHFKQIMSVRSC